MLIGIAAMTTEGLIGNENGLPWHIPTDLKFFKNATKGKTLIVGSKTFATLPPLPDRKIVVMSKDPLMKEVNLDIEVVNSLEGLKPWIFENDINFVAGGAAIYELLMPFCDYFYITEIIGIEATGDVYFPLDEFHDLFELVKYHAEMDETTSAKLIFKLYKKRRRL